MGLAKTVQAVRPSLGDPLGAEYLSALRLVERLHRQLLDVIKDELDRNGRSDVNSVQALLIFNIGEDELTAGELRTRGHYLGSNVSYNLKKLVEAGYISHERSDTDRRSVRVKLTTEGIKLCELLSHLFQRHLASLAPVARIDVDTLKDINTSLIRLERFWEDHIRYRL
jgi:DNA-binding MarR family transcriptional regulator